MGSASQALWCGVPTVAIPQAVDQFTIADARGDRSRRTLDAEDATAGALRDAVDALVGDPAVEHRAAALCETTRAEAGAARAADAIEAYLRRASP